MKQMPGCFAKQTWWLETCALALVEKTGNLKTSLCYPTIIDAVWWTVFLKLLFQSYKYQQTNVVYLFLEGNELNITFQFVILMLQNYIQRNKLYHSIWKIFTVLGMKSSNVW